MKKGIFSKIIVIILLSTVSLGGLLYTLANPVPSIILAAGDLDVQWGVPDGDPIFTISNALPGDTFSKTVTVINNATVNRPVAVRGVKTSELKDFSGILDIVIRVDGLDTFGGTSSTGAKTLFEFFTDSTGDGGIELGILTPTDSMSVEFFVTFPSSAGNEYQRAEVVFDIIFGLASDIPPECAHIKFSGPPIFGTEGDDVIHGTTGNDLIFALEGDDTVYAKTGNDCIIGGPGNDELRGEDGNDIIFGNDGDDLLIGGSGKDIIFGGNGADTIRGESGDDYIDAGDGDDIVTGGSGNDKIYGRGGNDNIKGEGGHDTIYGGDGNDTLDGGSGNDYIYGEAGDDTMHGASGNDTLIGGPGTDSANGSSGIDTCDAEVVIQCEL